MLKKELEKPGARRPLIGLKLARVVLVLFALALLLVWGASLPEYFRRTSTLTVPAYVRAGETLTSSAMILGAAAERDLSVKNYLVYQTIISLVSIGITFGVAGLLLWKSRKSWFSWLAALVLVGVTTGNMIEVLYAVRPPQGILYVIEAISWLAWPTMFLWLYLFPDGRAAPRWTRTPVIILLACVMALILVGFLTNIGGLPKRFEVAPQIAPLMVAGLLGLIVYSQVFRYRHVYGTVEREQVKWFLFAISILLLQVLLLTLTEVLGVAPSPILQDLAGLLPLLVPVSLVFAILRYHLYDIDLIINRTVVYVPLTAIMAGLIAVGAKLSQTVFIQVTGEKSDAALIASTFIVVSLSTPVKLRLQAFADRYFKEAADIEHRLRVFTKRVGEVVEVLDPARMADRFLEECVKAAGAGGGALYRIEGTQRSLLVKSDGWQESSELDVAVVDKHNSPGLLCLGKRKSGAPYSAGDRRAIEILARVIAPALGWTDALATV